MNWQPVHTYAVIMRMKLLVGCKVGGLIRELWDSSGDLGLITGFTKEILQNLQK